MLPFRCWLTVLGLGVDSSAMEITGGLGTHLLVKVPRPRDSEVTISVFESSCNLLLPV